MEERADKKTDKKEPVADKEEPVADKKDAPATEKPAVKKQEPEKYGGEFVWTQEQIHSLEKHNQLRNKHGAPSLKLSKGLSVMATKWAEHLASIDKMEHTTLEQRQHTGESLYVEHGRECNTGEGARGENLSVTSAAAAYRSLDCQTLSYFCIASPP